MNSFFHQRYARFNKIKVVENASFFFSCMHKRLKCHFRISSSRRLSQYIICNIVSSKIIKEHVPSFFRNILTWIEDNTILVLIYSSRGIFMFCFFFFEIKPAKLIYINSSQRYKLMREGMHIDSLFYRVRVPSSHQMCYSVTTSVHYTTPKTRHS